MAQADLLSSINTVSIVISRVQFARQDSLAGSTCNTHYSRTDKRISAAYTHNAISRANARKVDFADELDSGWLIRILIAAVHLQGVDSILVDTLHGNISLHVYRNTA